MIFSCTRDNLQKGLSLVSHISSKQINLPILQNVHVKAEGGSIVLSATNLEVAVKVSLRGKIDKPGEFTVPAKLFSDYVNLLSGDRVDIEQIDTHLEISCGESSTKMNGTDASEFPLIPSVVTKERATIPIEAFRLGLSQVLFSVATNEARPELAGVLIRFTGEEMILAATDSYRLAERRIPQKTDFQTSVIVPMRTLQELGRMMMILKDDSETGETVAMEFSENQAVFRIGSTELTTRMIDGTYPDYQQIIPKEFATELVVDREGMQKAIKAASLFSRTGMYDVAFSIQKEAGTLTASATDATRGSNVVTCEADVKGTDNAIMMNFRYVLDGLNAMSSQGITMKLIDAMQPCVLVPNGQADAGKYTYIVMPIRQ